MKITEVEFVISNTDLRKCPAADRPEYAFIGRSNVGKSSLINMLMGRRKLAKTSSTPGKTQLINHFSVNGSWYLVDLPGYGYAKVPKKERRAFGKMIADYVLGRENLVCMFVLIDARHSPQQIDLEFMEWLGTSGIPFCMVFTKSDKLKKSEAGRKMQGYEKRMLESWEELPARFVSSSITDAGRDELLGHIEELNTEMKGKFGKQKGPGPGALPH